MPIYEYECSGECPVFEVTQKMSEPALENCPTCGKAVKKLMSRTTFVLKGTGYYSTDYKKPASSGDSSGNS
jgi:putative FmdB family regulatory protein